MIKFEPCSKCTNGYIFERDIAVKCDCLKKWQKEQKILLNLDRAGLKDFNLDFSDYKGKDANNNLVLLKKYCSNITTTFRKEKNIYLYGPNGTQKTTIAKIVLKKCIEQGIQGKFILMSELVDILTDVFSDSPTREKELLNLYTIELLIIDDSFDKKKVTLYKSGYQLSFVDRFIRTRIEVNKLNTIFTSNVPIKDISKNGFTEDVQNLLYRTIEVKKGQLTFTDVYTENEVDIESIWD